MATLDDSSCSNSCLRIVDPFPHSNDYLVLLLVAHGLEDLAMNYLVERCVVASKQDMVLLQRPDVPAVGGASMDKIVLRLDASVGDEKLKQNLDALHAAPVIQAVLAFITAAVGLETQGGWEDRKDESAHGQQKQEDSLHVSPDQRWPVFRQRYEVVPVGILDQLAQLVGSSTRWSLAEKVLQVTGVGPVRRFRASCVTCGPRHQGFDCTDAMKVVGGGALSAHAFGNSSRWKVDLQRYEVELYGFVFEDHFACGLLLGGQWRRNTNTDKYSFSKAPSCERASRPFTVGDHQPWFMPRLRPSTAMLLLLLADLQPGEHLLDPMGGCGTIAIEAAVRFENVSATTSDNNSLVTSAAIKNCVLARPHLAAGSSIRAEDWDARRLVQVENETIDRVIADMPFGNRCRWNVAQDLPAVLNEVGRVLRPGGRAVFLTKGYRRIEALLKGVSESENFEDIDDVEETNLEVDSLACEIDPDDPEGLASQVESADTSLPGLHRTKKGTIRGCVTSPKTHECIVGEDAATNDIEFARSVDYALTLLDRRQVAVGGYLCYALVVQKEHEARVNI